MADKTNPSAPLPSSTPYVDPQLAQLGRQSSAPAKVPYQTPLNDGSSGSVDAFELNQSTVTVDQVNRIADADPTREYISGGNDNFVTPLLVRTLQNAFDDITGDFGDDVYEQMMRDPAVSSSVQTLKTLTMAEPLKANCAVEEADAPNYAKAKEYSDFIQWCLDNPERPLVEVLEEMLDALWRGSYVAEVVLRDQETGKYKGKQTLKKLAPKNPKRYWMVVDRFFNLLGIVRKYAFEIDYTKMTFQGHALVPRDHIAVMTFWGVGGDPRGGSILRPAYNAWYVRQQAWPAYLKWLVQWATPSLIGTTPEGVGGTVPVMDPTGTFPLTHPDGSMVTESPEAAMLRAMLGFQGGGSAMAIAGGSKMDKIQSTGEGQAFTEGFDMLRREIVLAILRVTRVTLEAKHGSKADSSDAHDILELFCDWIKQHVVAMITRDVVKPLMLNNFGPDSLELMPKISLSGTEKQDISKLGDTIARLFAAGYLHSSQIPGIDALLNLPERDMEAQLREEQDAEDQKRIQAQAMTRLVNPTAGVNPTGTAKTPPGSPQGGGSGSGGSSLGPPGSAARMGAANDAAEGVRKPGQ